MTHENLSQKGRNEVGEKVGLRGDEQMDQCQGEMKYEIVGVIKYHH